MKPTRARNGAALVMAVAVLGLIAVVMGMLLTTRATDVNRLRHEREGVQSEQMRLALIATAHAQLVDGKQVDGPVSLPEGFGEASIQWSGTTATLTIDQTRSAVVFEKTTAGWTLKTQ